MMRRSTGYVLEELFVTVVFILVLSAVCCGGGS